MTLCQPASTSQWCRTTEQKLRNLTQRLRRTAAVPHHAREAYTCRPVEVIPARMASTDPQGFWRNWHASYNLWLVRYMYVPLGGSRRRALNAWLVFTFVALWHDVEWRLLAWAWLMSLLFAPELVRRGHGQGTA